MTIVPGDRWTQSLADNRALVRKPRLPTGTANVKA